MTVDTTPEPEGPEVTSEGLEALRRSAAVFDSEREATILDAAGPPELRGVD